jgi:selT/selW/selH-like putative selenoprotein
LAASLHKRFGEEAEIKAGSTGQFDVVVDGQVIFSKAKAGRFPVEGEVEDLFAALKPAAKAPDAELPKDQGSGGRAGVLRRLSDKFRN